MSRSQFCSMNIGEINIYRLLIAQVYSSYALVGRETRAVFSLRSDIEELDTL